MIARWPRRRGFALAALAALPLLAGACGGAGGGVEVEVVTVTAVPTEPPPVTAERPAAAAAGVFEPPELVVSVEQVAQGSAILVSVTGSVAAGEVEFLGRRHPLIQGDFSKFSFVGVGVEAPPGVHPLRVFLTLTNDSVGDFERQITISETAWEVSYIYYREGAGDPVLDSEERAREQTLMDDVYAGETPEKLWWGRWQRPVEGPISSQFGERRSFNDGPVGGNHGGTDFDAPRGQPVWATNDGRVALARQLAIRGATVVIDHGGGVFSSYAHLRAFAVAEGQSVARGDLIGSVGSTGLSTAPHLHWEISVHGVLVDPMRWVDGRNGY